MRKRTRLALSAVAGLALLPLSNLALAQDRSQIRSPDQNKSQTQIRTPTQDQDRIHRDLQTTQRDMDRLRQDLQTGNCAPGTGGGTGAGTRAGPSR